MSTDEARIAAQNFALAAAVGSEHRGHLAGQRVLYAIREGGDGVELIELARAELADDARALDSFGRSLSRGRE